MKRLVIGALASGLLWSAPTYAHYGMIIPSHTMPTQDDPRNIELTLSFSHPFKLEGMELVTPRVFRLYSPAGEVDLLGTLQPAMPMGAPGFNAALPLEGPGLHVLYMEPEPYWEPAEDAFIVHHTKTYVAAYGLDDGWDEPLGENGGAKFGHGSGGVGPLRAAGLRDWQSDAHTSSPYFA